MHVALVFILVLCVFGVASKFVRVGSRKRPSNEQLFGRKLGLLERWYASFDPPRFFLQFAKISGPPITTAHVEKILEVLIHRFPVLSASLDYSSKVPAFAKLDMPNDYSFPVQFVEAPEGEWQSRAEKETNINHTPRRGITSYTALWRLFVLQDPANPTKFALLASFHHIIADGLSGVTFFKNFMEINNDLLAGSTPNNNEILTPLLEEMIDVRPYLADLIYEVFSAFGPTKKARTDYLGPLQERDIKKRGELPVTLHTNVHFMTLREDVLGPLRASCRKNNVTIHGALSAAVAFACTKVTFPSSFLRERFQISYEFPVSLRKEVPNFNSNSMGLMLCAASDRGLMIHIDSLFWRVAKTINSQTRKQTKEGTAQVGMLDFLPGSWEDFVNKTRYKGLPNQRVASIELSNLGQLDFSLESSGKHEVEDFTFIIPNHISGPVFCTAAATVGNVMNITTTTPAPIITKAAGEEFQKALLSALISASDTSFRFSDMYTSHNHN